MNILTKEFNEIMKSLFKIGHKKVSIDFFPSGNYIVTVEHSPKGKGKENI